VELVAQDVVSDAPDAGDDLVVFGLAHVQHFHAKLRLLFVELR
jgi:hypothetical protein